MLKFESERSFEDFLWEEFESTNMCPITDEEYTDCYRQFDTKGYGICDLVYVSTSPIDDTLENFEHLIHVVELKSEQVKPSDFAQLCRYKTFFERATKDMPNVTLQFSLVVPKGVINSQDCCYLTNALEAIIYVYEFSISPAFGIKFESTCGYSKNAENLDSILNIIPQVVSNVS